MRRPLCIAAIVGAWVGLLGCGSSGSGSQSAESNTLAFAVGAGPTNNYFNGGFVTVTVCAPGSSTDCSTIDDVLIDTGSTGLRLLKSALSASLPQQVVGNGAPLVECNQFLDGFTWGPVALADVKLGAEQASSIPVQVIDQTQFPNIPSECTSTGLTAEDTLDALAANGILGIGVFREDCGLACSFAGSSNPGLYFQCPAGACSVAAVPTSSQVQNPVALFPHDNNGIAITLPSIAPPGALTSAGTLIFGIGTQANNALQGARVHATDGNGDFTTTFRGQTYNGFIDSGSNGYYFLDSAATGIPTCPDNKDFYCPSATVHVSATNRGINGTTTTVDFSIDNADDLPARFAVLPTIGGTNAGAFDWGLPFFLGRTVFIAIENQNTPGGVGPYFAY